MAPHLHPSPAVPRLSTVASFDRVVVIDQGRLAEDGPPALLRHRGGVHERLWQLQADGAYA